MQVAKLIDGFWFKCFGDETSPITCTNDGRVHSITLWLQGTPLHLVLFVIINQESSSKHLFKHYHAFGSQG